MVKMGTGKSGQTQRTQAKSISQTSKVQTRGVKMGQVAGGQIVDMKFTKTK